ncbi:regulator of chromosome condensation 1/beta-lactamase-inhibitor protein II [Geopyxis carbonaria]|nr:regulator of chromosome condensation 1/beta-lactamase-inhibitor protein II [Geopyxis carbonaria]
MLLAIGSNGNGQLALGHREDTHIPERCIVPSEFPTALPKAIVAGGNHTLVLFPCGKLFATGLNNHGQCGIPVSQGLVFEKFNAVPPPPDECDGKWDLVAAGWDFSILVSTNGNLYSCGLGYKGELGLGPTITTSYMKKIDNFLPTPETRIVSISSGMAHTIAVLETGEIYGWGAGRKGQLGAPSASIIPSPRKIEVGFPVARAVCGREFGFAISKEGDSHAVFGGEKYSINSSAPPQGDLKGWKTISSSWGGVYVLLANKTITAWGRNDKGQLTPNGLAGIEEMAIGSEHGVALVRTGASVNKLRAVAWGWGEHGNCGKTKDDEGGNVIDEIFEVSMENNLALLGVGAGCATSWFWTE